MAGKKCFFSKERKTNWLLVLVCVCIFQLMTCIEMETIQLSTHTDTRALHSSWSSLWKRLGGPLPFTRSR
jgi:hypothetical protein